MMRSMSDDKMSLKSDGNNKMKLACSYGGKILPRPGDGHLRYSGGETRVVAFNRNVTFEEMKRKMEDLCGASVILKYQLPTEDLDTLVSVTCKEDLQNMKEEYDRFQSCCCPRVRVFLFPVKQRPSTENPTLEQRYIDAINGISPLPKFQCHCSASSATSSNTINVQNSLQHSPVVLSEVDMNKRSREMGLRKVRSEGVMLTHLMQRTHSSPNLELHPCINYPQPYASKRPFAKPVIVQKTREGGGELLRASRLGYSKSDISRPPQQTHKHFV